MIIYIEKIAKKFRFDLVIDSLYNLKKQRTIN